MGMVVLKKKNFIKTGTSWIWAMGFGLPIAGINKQERIKDWALGHTNFRGQGRREKNTWHRKLKRRSQGRVTEKTGTCGAVSKKWRKYLKKWKNDSSLFNAADGSSKMKTEKYWQFEAHWDLGKNDFGKVIRGKILSEVASR